MTQNKAVSSVQGKQHFPSNDPERVMLDKGALWQLEQFSAGLKRCNMGSSCPAFQKRERDEASPVERAHCLDYSHHPQSRSSSRCSSTVSDFSTNGTHFDEIDGHDDELDKLLQEALRNGVYFDSTFRSEIRRKMAHPQHVRMQMPLTISEMAAVMGFSKTKDSMSTASINGDYLQRWALFHSHLESAVRKILGTTAPSPSPLSIRSAAPSHSSLTSAKCEALRRCFNTTPLGPSPA